MGAGEHSAEEVAVPSSEEVVPALSVVVPVFNQGGSILENLKVIRDRIAERLDEPFEILVVSDGSIDETAERLLELRDEGNFSVFHYDRNLGKGYAVKLGALEARGEWIGYVDADLDLDPGGLADFLAAARARSLDFAIGSKRHPESHVHYPPSRRVASWFFQQLVRLLFRLDVRDTQVGIKLFRREVAEQVLPLLLVKRFAFDIELLAVSRALGFSRIEEQPIRLDYRFTGSGVRSTAVLRALVDTAAIFYRLRILRYYQRKRALGGTFGWTRPQGFLPRVSLVTTQRDPVLPEYPALEVVRATDGSPESLHAAANSSDSEVIAFLEADARAAANWISATVPFLRRAEVAAVVTPKMAPQVGSPSARAAAAVSESRLGGGSLYFRFTPGNLRYVDDFPTGSLLVRRDAWQWLGPIPVDRMVSELTAAGNRVLYTPETVVVAESPPLFRPHLAATFRYGRRRGLDFRRHGPRALRVTTLFPLGLLVYLGAAPFALSGGGAARGVWLAIAAAYAIAVLVSGAIAALRFRSLRVGVLALAGIVCSHAVFVAAFFVGLVAA